MLLASSEGYGKTYISSLAFVFSWFVHSRAVLFWKILSMINFYDFSIQWSYLFSIDLSISRIKSFYLVLHLLCFLYKIFVYSVSEMIEKVTFSNFFDVVHRQIWIDAVREPRIMNFLVRIFWYAAISSTDLVFVK